MPRMLRPIKTGFEFLYFSEILVCLLSFDHDACVRTNYNRYSYRKKVPQLVTGFSNNNS